MLLFFAYETVVRCNSKKLLVTLITDYLFASFLPLVYLSIFSKNLLPYPHSLGRKKVPLFKRDCKGNNYFFPDKFF